MASSRGSGRHPTIRSTTGRSLAAISQPTLTTGGDGVNTTDLGNAEADEGVTWDFAGLLEIGRASLVKVWLSMPHLNPGALPAFHPA